MARMGDNVNITEGAQGAVQGQQYGDMIALLKSFKDIQPNATSGAKTEQGTLDLSLGRLYDASHLDDKENSAPSPDKLPNPDKAPSTDKAPNPRDERPRLEGSEKTCELPPTDKVPSKQVMKAMELLKDGKIEDVCKMVREMAEGDDGDNAVGRFGKDLSKALDKDGNLKITFLGNGKYAQIQFGDHDPNARDQRETYTQLRIKADGTPLSAKEVTTGGGQRDEEKELDANAVYKTVMEKLKNKSSQNN